MDDENSPTFVHMDIFKLGILGTTLVSYASWHLFIQQIFIKHLLF